LPGIYDICIKRLGLFVGCPRCLEMGRRLEILRNVPDPIVKVALPYLTLACVNAVAKRFERVLPVTTRSVCLTKLVPGIAPLRRNDDGLLSHLERLIEFPCVPIHMCSRG